MTPINNTTYQVGYQLLVANTGNVPLANVQVVDDLALTFPTASSIVVQSVTAVGASANAAYNGVGDRNLLAAGNSLAVGANATINLLLRVSPGSSLGPYLNSATATGLSPGGEPVIDVSQDGSDPDPDGDGDPGNDGDPTPVVFPPYVVPILGPAGLLMLIVLFGWAGMRLANRRHPI